MDLVPGGSKLPVTERNKLRYLDALAQYKLASCVKDEIEAFLKGLNELIPDNLLSIFDENELEVSSTIFLCINVSYFMGDKSTTKYATNLSNEREEI